MGGRHRSRMYFLTPPSPSTSWPPAAFVTAHEAGLARRGPPQPRVYPGAHSGWHAMCLGTCGMPHVRHEGVSQTGPLPQIPLRPARSPLPRPPGPFTVSLVLRCHSVASISPFPAGVFRLMKRIGGSSASSRGLMGRFLLALRNTPLPRSPSCFISQHLTSVGVRPAPSVCGSQP